MQLILFLFLLGLAASSAQNITWQVPYGMEDGYYALSFPESDKGVLEPTVERIDETSLHIPAEIASELDPSNHSHLFALAPRVIALPISRSGCTRDQRLFDDDERKAVKQAMYHWCGYGFRMRSSQLMLGVKGKVFYWVCHHGQWKNPVGCSPEEWDDAEKFIDNKCGKNKGGWVTAKKLKKTYGRSPREEPITCDSYR